MGALEGRIILCRLRLAVWTEVGGVGLYEGAERLPLPPQEEMVGTVEPQMNDVMI